MVKAIIKAAEELKAPVMIQTTPSTVKYASLEMFAVMPSQEAARGRLCRRKAYKKEQTIL